MEEEDGIPYDTPISSNNESLLVLKSLSLLSDLSLESNELRECLEELRDVSVDSISEVVIMNLCSLYHALKEVFNKSEDFSSNSIYTMLLSIISNWTDMGGTIAHEINCKGLLLSHTKHLDLINKGKLSNTAEIEEVAIQLLMIIHNCIKDPQLPQYYFSNVVKWALLLSPWIQCSHYAMRLLSRFILGYCKDGLTDEELELLVLDSNDWNLLLKMLEDGSKPPFTVPMVGTLTSLLQQVANVTTESVNPSSDDILQELSLVPALKDFSISDNQLSATINLEDVEDDCYYMSMDELLYSISNLMCMGRNLEFLNAKFYFLLVKILYDGGHKEKLAVCKLVWSLSLHCPELSEEIRNAKSPLPLALSKYHSHENVELQYLSKCAMLSAAASNSNEDIILYIKQCYSHRMYSECIKNCMKLTDCVEANIFHAKSLYVLYTQEQALLESHLMQSVGEVVKKRTLCYSKAKKLISILLRVKNENLAFFDTECAKMLDLAMVDYAFETNKLRDVRHCLLCLKYQAPPQNATQEPKKQRYGLQASHLFPEGILRKFVSAVHLAKGKKVCKVRGFRPNLDNKYEALHASGECTIYMLCHGCEQMFSASESWFLNGFFNKLYDVMNPSSAKEAQDIPYNHHLYRFCTSMIFRLLRFESIRVLNSQAVYNIFSQCRNYLLSEDPIPVLEIYLLISPLFEEDEMTGSMNKFLAGALAQLHGLFPLDTDLMSLNYISPSFAHFFVIHMGIVNILVKFKPEEYQIDSRFRISDKGGVYSVPNNDVRKKLLPLGLYTLFQVYAMKMEKEWLEGPALSYDPVEDPQESKAATYGILEAEARDENKIINAGDLALASAEHSREFCFLPAGFVISPPLSIPEDHTILLHHTHGSKETGSIVFICVGSEENKGYGFDKPYIIVYNYKPGYVFSSGFFVSVDELKPLGFLPNSKGTGTVKNQEASLADLQGKDFAPIILCTLKEKGFYSLKSLICRLHGRCRELPLFDAQCTPCSVEVLSRCSYCANLCDTCFKPVPMLPITLEPPEDSDLSFKFCHKACYQLSVCPPKEDTYFIIDSNRVLRNIAGSVVDPESNFNHIPYCGLVSKSHYIHLHTMCVSTNWAGYLRFIELALCSGSFSGSAIECYYIVYHGRSLTGQQCLEFSVSNDFTPMHMLPYITHSEATEQLSSLKEDKVVRNHMQEIVRRINRAHGSNIQPSLSCLVNNLPSTLSSLFSPESQREDASVLEPKEESSDNTASGISMLFQ